MYYANFNVSCLLSFLSEQMKTISVGNVLVMNVNSDHIEPCPNMFPSLFDS